MSAALEGRYRAALRWYPRAWRAQNADAIVGTMLDQAEADGRDAPAPGEIRDLARSAIRTRLSGFENFYPRAVRDRVALVALLLGTSLSVLATVLVEWAPLRQRETIVYDDGSMMIPAQAQFGPFLSAGVLIFFLWILACGAVLLRQRALSVVLLLLTIPSSVVLYLNRPELWAANQTPPITLLMLDALALLVVLGNARRPLPPVHVGLSLLATGLVVLSGIQAVSVGFRYSVLWLPFEPRTIFVALLALAIVAGIRRSRAWAAAFVLSLLPWAVLSALYLVPVVVVAGAAGSIVAVVLGYGIWRTRRGGSATIA